MRYMSQPQQNFIFSLLSSREVPEALAFKARNLKADLSPMADASTIIDSLKACGWKPKAPVAGGSPTMAPTRNTVPSPIGFYRRGDKFFSIVPNKAKTRTYAKVFNHNTWVEDGVTKGPGWMYTPGMVYDLTIAEKVTVEEAVEFGKIHGRCLICARKLTVAKSILQGMGEKCKSRLLA